MPLVHAAAIPQALFVAALRPVCVLAMWAGVASNRTRAHSVDAEADHVDGIPLHEPAACAPVMVWGWRPAVDEFVGWDERCFKCDTRRAATDSPSGLCEECRHELRTSA